MLEVLHNEDGTIKAVAEYLIFDNEGRLNEEGNRLFVGELEINPLARGNGVIRKFTKTILNKYPKVINIIYFRLYKYPSRGLRVYTREQMLKEA